MKKILAGIACLALCVGAYAQGTVNFANTAGATGVAGGAPIFDVDGTTKLEGLAYLGQIYGGVSADSLAPYGDPLGFRTGAGAGFFLATTAAVSIATVAPGDTAAVVVKVWEAAGGTSFEMAQGGGFKYGESLVIPVITGGAGSPPSLPGNLVGMQSFSLVPEPSTYALLALGAAALFLRRRK
jgi:hypothetical protein